MEKGDIFICRKDIYYGNFLLFEKNITYIYINVIVDVIHHLPPLSGPGKTICHVLDRVDNGNREYFYDEVKSIFSEYFITKKEQRKMKLKSINSGI